MDSRQSQTVHSVPLEETQDEVSLERVFSTLWSYRRVIEVGIAIIMGVYVVIALAGFMLLPRERMSSVGFRLVFENVDDMRYPNGTTFATSDIIATPVLTEVYEKDDLTRYAGSFEEFKNSIFIRDANRDLELLDLEYSARLSDVKLAPVDRARIESEYRDKRKAMSAPYYSLTLRRSEWVTRMPAALTEKVLKDTLSTWAQQAEARKGVLRYNIAVATRASVPLDLVENEDYLIAADVLRTKTIGLQDTLEQIGRLPGVNAARVGSDRLSLSEVRSGLTDTMRFRLQPLIATITEAGATLDAKRLRVYLENQLARAREREAEQRRRVDTFHRSLAAYSGDRPFAAQAPAASGADRQANRESDQAGAMIPQVSDTFLDRIMRLSRQDADVKYRQDLTQKSIDEGLLAAALGRDIAYYEELLKRVPTGGSQAAGPMIRAATKKVYEAIVKSFDQANLFYAELSTHNLNAPSQLYTMSEPFLDYSQRALPLTTILMYGVLTFLLALFIVPLACLTHHATVARRLQKK